MAKATHLGTCQVCGSTQKLPGGRLSQHGYTVDWSQFVGTCKGSGARPFEESKELTEQVRDAAIETAATLRENGAAIMASTDESHTHIYYQYDPTTDRVINDWKKVIVTDNGNGDGRIYLDGIIAANYPQAKTAAEHVKTCNEWYAECTCFRTAKEYDQYIAWQTGRLVDWKPGELKPVPDENTPTVGHKEAVRLARLAVVSAVRDALYRSDNPDTCEPYESDEIEAAVKKQIHILIDRVDKLCKYEG